MSTGSLCWEDEANRDGEKTALLNGWWDFQPLYDCVGAGSPPDAYAERILVPSFWNTLPEAWAGDWGAYRNFDWPANWQEARVAAYRREVVLPARPDGMRLQLELDAVLARGRVLINGRQVLDIEDGFLPHGADVTDRVEWDSANRIEVLVAEAPKTAPGNFLRPAGSWLGWNLLGIWQDVRLRLAPEVRLADVFVQPSVRQGCLKVAATVVNDSPRPWAGQLRHWVRGEKVRLESGLVSVAQGDSRELVIEVPWERPRLWSPDDPHLYYLESALVTEGSSAERRPTVTRFGFKEFWIEETSFMLNGHRIRFRGDSWHYMGAAQQHPGYVRTWYEFAKGLGANAIRLHAMPHPRFYYDIADEVGLCVIDECAVYGSGGNLALDSEEFWEHARVHVKRLARRDRNHPSVCLWSASNEVVWKGGPAVFEPLLSLESAIQEVDTTRPVSFDENKSDLGGGARIMGGHYGSNEEWHRSWKRDRPLMVNEFGCLYYSGPEEPAKWGGEACFADFDARIRGGAAEAREMILGLRAMGAASLTPWNFVWYTLWPAFPSNELTLVPDESGPGIKTQRIGQHSLTLNYELEPGKRLDPDGPKWLPHAAHEPMKAAYARAGAFWRQAALSVAAGDQLFAIADLHNDLLEDAGFEVRVELGDSERQRRHVYLEAGTSEALNVDSIHAGPMLAGRVVDLTLRTLRDDAEIHRDVCRVWVAPPLEPLDCIAEVGDPSGRFTEVLGELGVKCRPWSPAHPLRSPESGLLIVFPHAWTGATLREAASALRMVGFFERGGRVVAWGRAFAADATSAVNPVEREFARSWRRACPEFWDTLPDDSFFAQWESDSALPYSNGAAARHAFPKPAQGEYRPLAEVADSGAGLEYSPLMALPIDGGEVFLCSYSAEAILARHPAALALLHRMITCRFEAAARGPLGWQGESPRTELNQAIQRTGVEMGAGTVLDSSPGAVMVIDGTDIGIDAASVPAEMCAAAGRGATVLIMNLTPDGATALSREMGVTLALERDEVENVAKASEELDHPLLDGISQDDLMWVRRGQAEPIVEWTITPTAGLRSVVETVAVRWKGYAEAAEQHKYAMMLRRLRAFEGPRVALGEVAIGSGRIIICQLRLAEARVFRRKASRVLTHLLRNAGARFAPESSPLLVRRSPFADENGFIRRWIMLGVFRPVDSARLMDEDYVGGETGLAPRLGHEAGGKQWFIHESGEPEVNLRAAFDGQLLDNVAVYAGIYVFSPTARDILLDTPDMVDLAVGSEDSVRAWLNGELILRTDRQRVYEADADMVRGVKLRRGWNVLVLKLMQRSWDWRMSARFLSSRGVPVEDLEYSFEPEA